MLRKEDNELITRVTGDAPMGRLLRNYWVPACRSEALKPGSDPKRVRLFGENYVVFRTEDGRIGFFNENCPHRGCSLLLARNEDCSLTCIFHGWKIDVTGKVVDVPTEPNRYGFGEKIKMGHFPTREAGSAVWVYVGEGEPPPFPAFEFNTVPADQVDSFVNYTQCNWVQGLEGGLDSAHVGILHKSRFPAKPDENTQLLLNRTGDNNAPYFEVEHTDYGLKAAAIRNISDGARYVRVTEYAFPYYCFIPAPKVSVRNIICAVPIDDEHTAQWYFFFNPDKQFKVEDYANVIGKIENKDDAYNPIGSFENNWLQIRSELKNHWTGMVNVPLQVEDFVVQESMGSIADRSKEQLGSSDTVIIQGRRLLLNAVKDYMNGKPPFGSDQQISYEQIRSNAFDIHSEQDWRRYRD